MVVKTLLCAFSEMKIYPGHGRKYIRKDGQPVLLLSHKMSSLYHQRKRPAKLQWSQAWRRLNKKGAQRAISKRRTRKTTKFIRAIVGASVEQIKQRRIDAANKKVPAAPAASATAAKAATKAVKDRQKKDRPAVPRQQAAAAKHAGKGR